ncbi:MAG: YheC/YheD family protein, partial [Patescibacteria group bacterium]
MKKLLFLANDSSTTKTMLEEHEWLKEHFELLALNYSAITAIKPEKVVFSDFEILIDTVDYIWLEYDWDAANANNNYSHFTGLILDNWPEKLIIYRDVMRRFYPIYDSKMFNATFLDMVGLPHPRTVLCDVSGALDYSYPLVLKEDISGMAKGVSLVHNPTELEKLVSDRKMIVQELKNFEKEFRVLTVNHQVIGSVERTSKYTDGGNRRLVNIDREHELSDAVIDICERLSRELTADLLGIDIGIDKDGYPWVIEFNVSPNFKRFCEITGIDVV